MSLISWLLLELYLIDQSFLPSLRYGMWIHIYLIPITSTWHALYKHMGRKQRHAMHTQEDPVYLLLLFLMWMNIWLASRALLISWWYWVYKYNARNGPKIYCVYGMSGYLEIYKIQLSSCSFCGLIAKLNQLSKDKYVISGPKQTLRLELYIYKID